MGYAMIMVLIYHYGCWVFNIFGEWNIGFVGVDIFMFLSGWGLVFSYEKSRDVKEFYKKRAIRILPTFYLMYLLIIAYRIVSPSLQESVTSITLELSTLSYWLQTDPTPVDWFLNCIIGYYLIFPLLKKYISVTLLLIVTVCVVLFDLYATARWDLASGIDRLPIFVFGILFAVSNYNRKRSLIICGIILLLFVPIYKYVNTRLAFSFMMYVVIVLCAMAKLPKIKCVEWIGEHTLSLYAANMVTFMFMSVTNRGLLIHSIAYLLLQSVFTIVFVLFDKHVTQLLRS